MFRASRKTAWTMMPLLSLLLGCLPKQRAALESIRVMGKDEPLPEGTQILDEVTIHSAPSEDFCLKRLRRKALKMGGDALVVRSQESSLQESSEFYPPLGRRVKKEWTDHSMTASVILLGRTPSKRELSSRGSSNAKKHQQPIGLDTARKALDQGRWEDALADLLEASAFRPDGPELYEMIGLAYAQGKRNQDAVTAWRKALDLDPTRIHIAFQLGTLLMKESQHQEALEWYDKCLSLGYQVGRVQYNRGRALYALGRFKEALQAYDQALLQKNDWPECHWNRAAILEEMSLWAEANRAWSSYLRLRPDAQERKDIEARMAQNRMRALGKLPR